MLTRAHLSRWVILVAVLLVTPCLTGGLMADDYIQQLRMNPDVAVAGFPHAPMELFTFASGDAERTAAMEEGFFAWWTAPDFRMAFWRPLASATHVLDWSLWRAYPPLSHAHSILWFAALLWVVALLYRRFHAPFVANLALVFYALDDARGMVLSFVANRNVLISAVLSFGALIAHDRWRRDGWRTGAWLGPLLFAGGLLAGESALALTGYLFAHALFLDAGSPGRRMARLWPYATLSVVWMVVYKLLGYGTAGGGIYVNPSDEPLVFLRALVERLPVLILAQNGGTLSDLWLVLPTPARIATYGLALVTMAIAIYLVVPLWRSSPVARFWILGSLCAVVPICATFPADRLLVFVGVGAMAVTAMLVDQHRATDLAAQRSRAWQRTARVVVLLLVILHAGLAPLLLPLRSLTVDSFRTMIDPVDAAIPKTPDIADRTLVVINAPMDGAIAYTPLERAALGIPRPRAMRLLASGTAPVAVSRTGPTTLRIRPENGFCSAEVERMVRGLSRPFHVGDEVTLPDVRVVVTGVMADGRAAEADFHFTEPFDHPTMLWMRWEGAALVPYSPPPVGATEVLPGAALGGRS